MMPRIPGAFRVGPGLSALQMGLAGSTARGLAFCQGVFIWDCVTGEGCEISFCGMDVSGRGLSRTGLSQNCEKTEWLSLSALSLGVKTNLIKPFILI